MSEQHEAPETRATLAAALAATRRSFDGRSERARYTERRILESVRTRTRMPKVFWLVPVAAAFVVTGAFADEIGGRLADLTTRLFAESDPIDTAPSSSASSAVRAPHAPPPVAPSTSPSAAPAPSVSVPSEPIAPRAAPPSVVPPLASTNVAPARQAPSSPPATEVADELVIYKEAHRAHFIHHDYESALAGWDRYLAAAPRGTFALEARYNRAIALYRLGHRDAALEALRPFADGAYGRYRRDEAREVIEKLR
jgi:hypothetical protein